jgi:hypothetical protein
MIVRDSVMPPAVALGSMVDLPFEANPSHIRGRETMTAKEDGGQRVFLVQPAAEAL